MVFHFLADYLLPTNPSRKYFHFCFYFDTERHYAPRRSPYTVFREKGASESCPSTSLYYPRHTLGLLLVYIAGILHPHYFRASVSGNSDFEN